MRKNVLYIALFTLVFSCASGKKTNRYLPETLESSINFGLPLAEFIKIKGNKVELQNDGMDFRKVYFETVENQDITYFAYYFDAESTMPLYEVIIGYKTIDHLNKAAIQLLGQPNYNDTEWKITRENDFDLLAWRYKEKLVVAALIPDTEWYESQK